MQSMAPIARTIMGSAVTALWFNFGVLPVTAGDTLTPLRTDAPPQIDGKLDDDIWQTAPYVEGFKTFTPDYGIDMVEKTHVYYAYDRENLYFGFRCFDSEPDKIKTSIARRDNIRPDDWVCINLDSFNDQQALYAFYVNPAGIQADSRYASGREDHSVDLIWYSQGAVDQHGYTIEVKIPFKSIRFANKDSVEMGVIFERRISRRSEQGTYPPLDPDKGSSFLTQMKPIILRNVKRVTLFELLPATTYSQTSSLNEGRLRSEGRDAEFSITAKYGLTSKLVLDGTYNPDFSQVEADAGQVDVNLRFALFFPEKRPFFLEGSENFNFAGSSGHNPLRSIVHTRTIVDPTAGVKLSGKIGKKNTFASINAIDRLPAVDEGSEDPGDHAVFSIFRYKRALNDDSYLGAVYTGREIKSGFNRVLGADGQVRVSQASILNYHMLLSQSKEGLGASTDGGHASGLDYSFATRKWHINAGLLDISQNFHTATGFLTRTDISRAWASVGPRFYPKSPLIRRIDPSISTVQTRDKQSDLYETENTVGMRFVLWRNSSVSASLSHSSEVFLSQKFSTSGWRISASSQFTRQLFFSLSLRRGNAIRFSEDPFQGRGTMASADVTYQPSDKINVNVVYTFSNLFRSANSEKIFDVSIIRPRFVYQVNKYLFFRGIIEYNSFRERLLSDFLASFTYIPGTVLHFGYGALYEKTRWQDGEYQDSNSFLETRRGIFVKASYLWRM